MLHKVLLKNTLAGLLGRRVFKACTLVLDVYAGIPLQLQLEV